MVYISTKELIFLVFIVTSLAVVGAFGGGVGIYGIFIGMIIGVRVTTYAITHRIKKAVDMILNPSVDLPKEEKKPEETEKPKEA
jgi:hypothetical protein